VPWQERIREVSLTVLLALLFLLPRIAAVSFVGSTPIARYIYETAARRGKRCQALGVLRTT
jgi:malonate-semialdehyde dehydrogenase (acetylating) / methylmalonate-semialdehyde dehydrogenase